MLPVTLPVQPVSLRRATQQRCPVQGSSGLAGSAHQPLHSSFSEPFRIHSHRHCSSSHVVPGAQHGSLHHLASTDRAMAHVIGSTQQHFDKLSASSDAAGVASGSGKHALHHSSALIPAASASLGGEVSTSNSDGQVGAVRRPSGGRAGRLSFPAGLGRVSFHRRSPSTKTLVTKVVLSREMADLVARARLVTERQMRSWEHDSIEMKRRLGELGGAGIVAYGLLNTIYYSLAFLGGWYLVAKVPAGLGMKASARKFVEVMAMVWAGSQVTKVPRAGGALALAPFVDRALDAAVAHLNLRSKRDALILAVVGCLVVAAAVFGAVIVMHA